MAILTARIRITGFGKLHVALMPMWGAPSCNEPAMYFQHPCCVIAKSIAMTKTSIRRSAR
jgi:hypothetical protein